MRNILLLEPGYLNKYPPLGLMKISAYHKQKGDKVHFAKGLNGELLKSRWDRVYVTTLFSFEYKRISKQIDFAIECAGGQHQRVFVGGIAASLMTEEFLSEPQWFGVRFIRGLLDKSPAESLQLDEFNGDFGADDIHGKPIEDHVPDYSILADIEHEYQYPVRDAYFGYASRGCIRKCHFCGVPKLEGAQRDSMPITDLIENISSVHGEMKDLVLMDNNITASARYKEIIAEIRDNGFERGATITRNGKKIRRRVDFNQGVDARILTKDKFYLKEMSTICISPLRIAFDHLGLRKSYSQSVRYAAEFGITQLSNYMLYNFHDTPSDLFQRLWTNIELNEELNVRIWSFPMRFQPVTLKDRSHIGEKWTWYQLRSFQIILQATHGVVSGNPGFFRHAFGATVEEFEQLLFMPHHMIFHREYYERLNGKAEKDEWRKLFSKLTESQHNEFKNSLSLFRTSRFKNLDDEISTQSDSLVKNLLEFYRPLVKEDDLKFSEITKSNKVASFASKVDPALSEPSLSEEEWVEDAGLYDGAPAPKSDNPVKSIAK